MQRELQQKEELMHLPRRKSLAIAFCLEKTRPAKPSVREPTKMSLHWKESSRSFVGETRKNFAVSSAGQKVTKKREDADYD
jgi:hypothetical protein